VGKHRAITTDRLAGVASQRLDDDEPADELGGVAFVLPPDAG